MGKSKEKTGMKRKQLTFQPLRLEDEKEVLIRVLTPINDSKNDPQEGTKRARVCLVDELDEDGVIINEKMSLVTGSVLESTFNEQFPGESYVGEIFAITRHAKKNGKNYKTYSVFQIESDR